MKQPALKIDVKRLGPKGFRAKRFCYQIKRQWLVECIHEYLTPLTVPCIPKVHAQNHSGGYKVPFFFVQIGWWL